MNIELVFALFLALLYGPTVLWLGYRAIRGDRRRVPSNVASEPTSSSQLAPDEVESPDDPDGFWVCGSCRSLNRRESNRCYSCRMAKSSASRQAPGEPSASGWVPVMDGIARSSGEAAGTTATPMAPWNAPKVPEPVVRAPAHLLAAAPPEAPAGVPVCPFLGLRSDPSTRYDFPDPGNFCRATGAKRAQPIDVEHQESRCLTAAHEQCARYRAVEVVAANR